MSQKYGGDVSELHNEKLLIGAKIDELLKPFLHKWQLQPQDVEISINYGGVGIKVKL